MLSHIDVVNIRALGQVMAYHHGGARTALLAAAAELLESEGAARLSLRQLAERAGLSRQAPYNHFEDKEALLAELVREGFQRLTAAIEEVAASVDPLEATADAYIGFAQASPALFRLMFSKELVDLSHFPDAAEAARGSFEALKSVVARVAEEGQVENLSLAAWSLVHGYASLCVEMDLEPVGRRAERALLFARIIRAAP